MGWLRIDRIEFYDPVHNKKHPTDVRDSKAGSFVFKLTLRHNYQIKVSV